MFKIEWKNSKYKSLLPLIKEKYKLKNVSSHFSGAGKYYSKQRVLPHNIAEVDLAVKKVYYSNKYLKIYAKSGSYFCHQARTIIELFNKKAIFVKRKKYATMFAPKEKVSLKQRILHNFVVYKVGMALFPKGSKIRKFLKSKL